MLLDCGGVWTTSCRKPPWLSTWVLHERRKSAKCHMETFTNNIRQKNKKKADKLWVKIACFIFAVGLLQFPFLALFLLLFCFYFLVVFLPHSVHEGILSMQRIKFWYLFIYFYRDILYMHKRTQNGNESKAKQSDKTQMLHVAGSLISAGCLRLSKSQTEVVQIFDSLCFLFDFWNKSTHQKQNRISRCGDIFSKEVDGYGTDVTRTKKHRQKKNINAATRLCQKEMKISFFCVLVIFWDSDKWNLAKLLNLLVTSKRLQN